MSDTCVCARWLRLVSRNGGVHAGTWSRAPRRYCQLVGVLGLRSIVLVLSDTTIENIVEVYRDIFGAIYWTQRQSTEQQPLFTLCLWKRNDSLFRIVGRKTGNTSPRVLFPFILFFHFKDNGVICSLLYLTHFRSTIHSRKLIFREEQNKFDSSNWVHNGDIMVFWLASMRIFLKHQCGQSAQINNDIFLPFSLGKTIFRFFHFSFDYDMDR